MIRPMTRYSFLLYHRDVPTFLENLRTKGLVDITTTSWVASEQDRAVIERSQNYRKIVREMASITLPEQGSSVVPFKSADIAVDAYNKAKELIETTKNTIEKARKEAIELELWGDFDPKLIEDLRRKGLTFRFFSIDSKGYNPDWEEQYPIEIVAQNGSLVYFAVVEEQGGAPSAKLNLGMAMEVKAPQTSHDLKLEEIEKLLATEIEQRAIVARAAMSLEIIKDEYLRLQNEFDFTQALNSGDKYAEGTLVVLEGWSLVEDRQAIEQFAQGEDVVYTSEDAKAEQNPPIKLKNNFFARLYEPIGSLYMLPKYGEMDLTPFFAPFFMIFFGMCVGDAGYGLLFIVAIAALWRKIPVKFRDYAWLLIFLNIAAVFFGLLTGNCFGIELGKVPALVEFKKYFVSNDNMFNVAIGLGAAQVFFGLILRIFNRSKKGGSFVYGLSALGWVLLILFSGLAYVELTPWFTLSSMAYYVGLAVACILIFFFNSPKKNPFLNFGVGLYNCYEMATGVIGDLVSYVRLFAIGLSGAIIAQVFNALSVGLSGDIPVISPIFMILILIIGHALTIFISFLGAFVHPVRLTFVEFFKNAEFEGGGRKFTPFAKHEK